MFQSKFIALLYNKTFQMTNWSRSGLGISEIKYGKSPAICKTFPISRHLVVKNKTFTGTDEDLCAMSLRLQSDGGRYPLQHDRQQDIDSDNGTRI